MAAAVIVVAVVACFNGFAIFLLSCCRHGPLPADIAGASPALVHVNVSHNLLAGTLPALIPWTQLSAGCSVAAGGNEFACPLPAEVYTDCTGTAAERPPRCYDISNVSSAACVEGYSKL